MDKEQETLWKTVRNRTCVRVLLLFIGVFLVQIAAQILCMAGAMLYYAASGADMGQAVKQIQGNERSVLAWISLAGAVLNGVWCGILYRKSSWRQERFDYRSAFCARNLFCIAGIGIGGCVVFATLLGMIKGVMPETFADYDRVMDSLMDSSSSVTMLYVLLFGPIAEELVFRGAILDRLHMAFPFLGANCIQAVLFGVYHMNLIQGLYAFALGLLLGRLCQMTGSILASVIAHILFNSTSYFEFMLPEAVKGYFVFGGFFLFAAGIYLAFQRKGNPEEENR